MTTHTITVTQADIDAGVKGKALCCPIALAMRRVWLRPAVGAQHCWPHHKAVKLPKKAADFVDRFDRGLYCEPFEFTVSV